MTSIYLFIYSSISSYPSNYINEQFRRFFTKHIPSITSSSLILPLIDNEQQFFVLRENLLAQPSIQQAISMKSAANVTIITNSRGNQATTTPLMETIVQQTKNDKYKNTIFIHCIHEARFIQLKRHIHDIYNGFFKKDDHDAIRLVIGNQNNPNLDFELAHKRPRSSLAKDLLKQIKHSTYFHTNNTVFKISRYFLTLFRSTA